MTEEKKKHKYDFVKIKNSEVAEKRETSRPNLFQRIICKIIRVVPSPTYQYMIRIQYSGKIRLQKNDVVVNKHGIQMLVANEQNRYALLLSMPTLIEKPYMWEKLYLLPKPKKEKK